MKKTKKMNNKGFSLVELIIVVAIMAVLVGVLAPQYMKYVETSRESADLDTYEAILGAIEVYAADPSTTAVTNMTAAQGKAMTFAKNTTSSADTEIGTILSAQGITIGSSKMLSEKYSDCTITLTYTAGVYSFTFSGTDGSAVKTALGR